MKNKKASKIKSCKASLDLEIIELESRLAPVSPTGRGQLNSWGDQHFMSEGAEC